MIDLFNKNVANKRILITGGAQGIGLCLAREFVGAGARVIISDINEEALNKAFNEFKQYEAQIECFVADASDRQQIECMAKQVLSIGNLDILVNNAGVGFIGELAETPIQKWEQLMAINFWGPLYHVYAFLPYFVKRGRGHIVNISSGQSFFMLPTWGAYSIGKLAVAAFSELLGYELKKFGIKTTTVYPFMVNTGFYKDIPGESWGAKLSMRLVPYYSMTPEKVGRIIFEAIRKEKRVEMVSFFNKIGELSRFIPGATALINSVSLAFLGKARQEMSILGL